MRRIATALFAMLLATTFAIGSTDAASAEAPNSPPIRVQFTHQEISEIDAYYANHGVNRQDRARVMAKLRQGKLPMSETGASPVDERVVEEDTTVTTISIYGDGSISVSTVPNLVRIRELAESSEIGPMDVSGCQFSGSTYAGYWTNCKLSEWSMTLRIEYTFDYSNTQGVGSSIDAYCCAYFDSTGGTFSGGHFTKQSSTVLDYGGTFTYYGGTGSQYRSTRIIVSGNTVSSSRNWSA